MMNLESRLQRLERRVTRSTLSPGVSLIYPSGGAWALNFGLNGGGKNLSSTHASVVAAENAYNKLLSRYPAGRDAEPVLIICDV